MSILVKAVLASTVISIGTATAGNVTAAPYCCRQPAFCDAACASRCCQKKLTAKLLTPVLAPNVVPLGAAMR